MESDEHERRDIVRYVEIECRPDKVTHAEKIRTETVWGERHDMWDVRVGKKDERFWVITNLTNLYSQDDFKSLEMAFTYHLGLGILLSRRQSQERPDYAAENQGSAWRVYEDAARSLSDAQEAQDFQAVGARLREALLATLGEIANPVRLPLGTEPPKAGDFLAWSALAAAYLAPGPKADHIRSALSVVAREAWQYVAWLTHERNAIRLHAEIAITLVSDFITLLGLVQAAGTRSLPEKCPRCGSYRIKSVFHPELVPADRVADPSVKAETLFCPACRWEEPWEPLPYRLRAYKRGPSAH